MLEMLKARKEALQERGVKGFTLMEMLIVIAIIAVLIAIAIPVLTAQLESARDATTCANLRSAYAEASATMLDPSISADNANISTPTKSGDNTVITVSNVDIESTDTDYGTGEADLPFTLAASDKIAAPASNGKVDVTFTFAKDGTVSAKIAAHTN